MKITPEDFISSVPAQSVSYRFNEITDWVFNYFSLLAKVNKLGTVKKIAVRNFIDDSSIPSICCFTGLTDKAYYYENSTAQAAFVTDLIITDSVNTTAQKSNNVIIDIALLLERWLNLLIGEVIETSNMFFMFRGYELKSNAMYFPNLTVGSTTILYTLSGVFGVANEKEIK